MNWARHSISLKYFLMKSVSCAKIDGTEVFYVKQCKPVRQTNALCSSYIEAKSVHLNTQHC